MQWPTQPLPGRKSPPRKKDETLFFIRGGNIQQSDRSRLEKVLGNLDCMVTLKGYQSMPSLVTLAEAASYLGVSKATLRNWDREGKLKAHRHPLNRYRVY